MSTAAAVATCGESGAEIARIGAGMVGGTCVRATSGMADRTLMAAATTSIAVVVMVVGAVWICDILTDDGTAPETETVTVTATATVVGAEEITTAADDETTVGIVVDIDSRRMHVIVRS